MDNGILDVLRHGGAKNFLARNQFITIVKAIHFLIQIFKE